jgi:hypothetical protein
MGASFQERADNLLELYGKTCPAPALGADPGEYRRAVLKQIAGLLPRNGKRVAPDRPSNRQLRKLEWSRCDDAALGVLEPQLFEAGEAAVHDPDRLPDDERELAITKVLPNGYKEIEFIRRDGDCFTKDFERPCKLVRSFRTPYGLMTSNGRIVATTSDAPNDGGFARRQSAGLW